MILPQGAAVAQAGTSIYPGEGLLHFALLTNLNQPPPCFTGFLPASEVAVAGRHHDHPAAVGHVLQDPEGLPRQCGPRCA